MAAKKQGLMKDGTRRTTATKGGRGGGMPRIMWLAVLVCVVGAVFLFRSQNSDVPTGIGENQTVVTAPDVESTLDQVSPRSGDVDINEQAAVLTPETPKGGSSAKTEVEPPAETKVPVAESAPNRSAAVARTPPPAPIMPMGNGPYVVQVGSFGDAENADKEANRLRKLGWDALVKMGNTSTGGIIQRVHIGYFKSRADAEAFINQNRKQIGGAIAVHR